MGAVDELKECAEAAARQKLALESTSKPVHATFLMMFGTVGMVEALSYLAALVGNATNNAENICDLPDEKRGELRRIVGRMLLDDESWTRIE